MDRMAAFKKISEFRDFAETIERDIRNVTPGLKSFTLLEVTIINDFSGDKISLVIDLDLLNHCADAMEESLINNNTSHTAPPNEDR